MGDLTTTPSTLVASTVPLVSTTSAAASTSSSSAAPTKVTYEVPFEAVSSAPADWEVAFFASYGPGEGQVGSGVDIGEEYGPYEPVVVDRDGYWRVADVYKSRVARFDENGDYVDSVPTPELLPMAGMVGLESGVILAAASGNQIAVIAPDSVTLHSAEGSGNPILMDSFGNSGFGVGSNGMVYEFRFDGDDLLVERDVEHFRGPDGVKYRFGAADLKTLWLRIPDVNTTIDLIPVPDDGSETEVALGESVRDRQGRTHVILYGTSFGSPETQRGVYLRIDGTQLAVTAPMPNIFSGWGWSLLTNLTVDNYDNALITAIDPDGVRVWRHEG